MPVVQSLASPTRQRLCVGVCYTGSHARLEYIKTYTIMIYNRDLVIEAVQFNNE